MDSLLTIIIVLALTALSSWLKKKGWVQEDEAWGEQPHPPPAPPTQRQRPPARSQLPPPKPAAPTDWERQLRRILQGELPPALPPVIEPARPAPRPTEPALPPPLVAAELETEGGPGALAQLSQSAVAYEKAKLLHSKVAEHLQEIKSQTEKHRPVMATAPNRAVSREVTELIGQLRYPKMARQAMMASFILGPPKSLENTASF